MAHLQSPRLAAFAKHQNHQKITPHGTPEEIDALIREEVEKIATKDGGLCMVYGLYPGVPLENAKAVMDAMEKYAFYFS